MNDQEVARVRDVIDRLVGLGLSETEASAYVHLSMLGASKASEVAASARLNRTEAYRILQALVQRGFASSTLERPTRFEAAPPEKIFSDLLAAEQERAERIARTQSAITSALETLRATPAGDPAKNTFKILQGRREIYHAIERMVQTAERGVKAVSTHPSAIPMLDTVGLWDLAGERVRNGVSVRIAISIPDEWRGKVVDIAREKGIEFRPFESERLVRYVVSDERELLMYVVSDPSGRLASGADVAIWTDAVDFVGTQSVLFDKVWSEAPPVTAGGPGTEERGSGAGRA